MAKRRGRSEGSIFKRANGQWAASISLGYDAEGRRKRRTIYGKTKKDVQQKLSRLQHAALTGALVEPTKLTVGEYMERWLEDAARPAIRRSTYIRYDSIIKNHITPHVGHLKLAQLNPGQVQSLYRLLEKKGASPRTRPRHPPPRPRPGHEVGLRRPQRLPGRGQAPGPQASDEVPGRGAGKQVLGGREAGPPLRHVRAGARDRHAPRRAARSALGGCQLADEHAIGAANASRLVRPPRVLRAEDQQRPPPHHAAAVRSQSTARPPRAHARRRLPPRARLL